MNSREEKLRTVSSTESTFRSMQATVTAVTVTYGISHEGLELEDPANEPNYDHLLVLGVTPEKAPDGGRVCYHDL